MYRFKHGPLITDIGTSRDLVQVKISYWHCADTQCQFENHLRAILDLPLGSTASTGHAGMINLIGEISTATRSLEIGVLHDYGKAPREARKLGHVTVVADTAEQRDALIDIIDNSVT